MPRRRSLLTRLILLSTLIGGVLFVFGLRSVAVADEFTWSTGQAAYGIAFTHISVVVFHVTGLPANFSAGLHYTAVLATADLCNYGPRTVQLANGPGWIYFYSLSTSIPTMLFLAPGVIRIAFELRRRFIELDDRQRNVVVALVIVIIAIVALFLSPRVQKVKARPAPLSRALPEMRPDPSAPFSVAPAVAHATPMAS